MGLSTCVQVLTGGTHSTGDCNGQAEPTFMHSYDGEHLNPLEVMFAPVDPAETVQRPPHSSPRQTL